MAIYLELDGIKGSSTNENFKDQIELTSFQWGAGLGVGSPRGGDRSVSEASVSEISGTKQLDKATEGLFRALLKAKPVGKGKISFVVSSDGESVAYSTLELENVIVSGYSVSGSGQDILQESLSLNFTKFVWSFTGRDVTQAGSPVRLPYDLSKNKLD